MPRSKQLRTPSVPDPVRSTVETPSVKRADAFVANWRTRRLQLLLVCLGLLAATFLVYSRVGNFGYTDFDDPAMVFDNVHVKNGFVEGSIPWAFTDTTTFYWQPLTWMSHMLDCEIFGAKAGPQHLESVAFHAINGVLLFLLLLYMTGSLWRSALVAGLFALHPLRVESVVWIAERRDVLSGLFSILTLWAYVRYTERPASWMRYALVIVTFWLALMSKPMALTLPLVMLLIDHWPLHRFDFTSVRKLIIEKIPLFISAAASAAITFYGNYGQSISLEVLSFRARIATAFSGYAAYLGKLVWPLRLGAFYPHIDPGTLRLIGAGFVLVFFSVLALRSVRRAPYLFTGWFWFLLTLLPVIGFVQSGGQFIADRFTYLPLIGVCIAVVWLAGDYLERYPRFRPASIAVAAVLLVAFGALSWRQTGYWADKYTVYQRAIEVTDGNERMWYTLANLQSRDNDIDGAIRSYREAIRLQPDRADDHEALAQLYMRIGRYSEAVPEYREVVRVEPENVGVLRNLGLTLIQAGAVDEAVEYLRTAERLSPGDPSIQQLLTLATTLQPAKPAVPSMPVENVPHAEQVAQSASDPLWHSLSTDESLEIGIILGFVLVALLWPEWGSHAFARVESWLARLARKPLRAMAVAALLPMTVRLLFLPVYPIPEPSVHDEFGYLLLADTFANGRLANPPHPMRDHLEGIYVLQDPTYTSYYPIAQGILLAVAKIIGVTPWLAVWLSVGLMCAAFFWMLSGWMPPRWALVGALLAGLRFSILSQWMNSYWGGAVGAIGGALVFGSLPRILRGQGARYAALLGVGVAILAQSRPYETFLAFIPVSLLLLLWVFRTELARKCAAWLLSAKLAGWPKANWNVRFTQVVLPVGLFLLLGAAFTAYYNWRVTGNPLQLPYQLYQKQYGVPQSFYWQKPQPPGNAGKFQDLLDTYNWQLERYNARRTFSSLANATISKLQSLWNFYFHPVWTIPLFILPWLWLDRRLRFLLVTSTFVFLGVLLYPFFFPHYLAPICGILLLIVVEGIRRLRLWEWRNRPVGASLARSILMVSLLGLLISTAGEDLMNGENLVHKGTPRGRILKKLDALGGNHLILVRYAPNHIFHYSVINNDADINGSHVVWARDMGPARNAELIHYFADRTAWLFDADQWPIHLVPYNNEQASPTAAMPAAQVTPVAAGMDR